MYRSEKDLSAQAFVLYFKKIRFKMGYQYKVFNKFRIVKASIIKIYKMARIGIP